MYDIFLNHFKKLKNNNNFVSSDILVTIHRPENTDNFSKMLNIVKNLNELSKKYKVLFPIHPRTKKILIQFDIFKLIDKRVKIRNPLAYKEIINYLKYCKLLVTDSGGLQKEAFFSKTQAITVRDQTEWPETIEAGWNRLVKPNNFSIYKNALKFISKKGLTKNLMATGMQLD
jgi:UDP-GlcNAc3NAcA epimerase